MQILLIGDSHTAGTFGSELKRQLREQGHTVYVHAVVGSSPRSWAPALPALVREHVPDLVLLALGANIRGNPSSLVARDLAELSAIAVSRGASLVWVGPPRTLSDQQDGGASLETFNRVASEAVSPFGTYLSSSPFLPRYAGSDGIHYGGTEGTALAKEWARQVAATLSSHATPAAPGSDYAVSGASAPLLLLLSAIGGIAYLWWSRR